MIVEILDIVPGEKRKCIVICEGCNVERTTLWESAKKSIKLSGNTPCAKCVFSLRSEEEKAKIRENKSKQQLGFKYSEESKEKMRQARLGEKNHFFGHHHTNETKEIMRLAKIGKVASEETRKLMSEQKSGSKHWAFGSVMSEATKQKISDSNTGKHKGELNSMFGLKGQDNPNWKLPEERKTELGIQIRKSEKGLKWRGDVFARDGTKCVCCDNTNKKELQVDHIKAFAVIIAENNITNLDEAILCEELWNIENGRVICVKCHKETDTWGHKTKLKIKELKNNVN